MWLLIYRLAGSSLGPRRTGIYAFGIPDLGWVRTKHNEIQRRWLNTIVFFVWEEDKLLFRGVLWVTPSADGYTSSPHSAELPLKGKPFKNGFNHLTCLKNQN